MGETVDAALAARRNDTEAGRDDADAAPRGGDGRPLRILHVFRAPVGGLFRHVSDLARLQAERGHKVGLVADATTGGEIADAQLAALSPMLALGVLRAPMSRNPHPGDLLALRRIDRFIAAARPDVVHGHGAKGGLYARLPRVFADRRYVTAYTPHGGSLNYFPGTLVHRFYMAMERLLERGTDVFLFESAFVAERYRASVGPTKRMTRVFLNGLHPAELEPIAHLADAADLMFIGELRYAKGIDVLLEALAALAAAGGLRLSLEIVGAGPDHAALAALSSRLGLDDRVRFLGPGGARQSFARGRVMVVPSRFESMPYVVLEAAGCAQPLISTKVGGIPEIFGEDASALIEPGDVDALARALADATGPGAGALAARTARLAARVATTFSASKMASDVLAGYRAAIAAKASR
jgi:glycosyltransferase involved in cell wall biosynthesis